MTTTLLSNLRTYRPLARAKRALTRGFLDWAAHCVAADLRRAQRHLTAVEEDLDRQLPPEVHADLKREAVNLRARVEAYAEELAMVDAKRAQFNADCENCPSGPTL